MKIKSNNITIELTINEANLLMDFIGSLTGDSMKYVMKDSKNFEETDDILDELYEMLRKQLKGD